MCILFRNVFDKPNVDELVRILRRENDTMQWNYNNMLLIIKTDGSMVYNRQK